MDPDAFLHQEAIDCHAEVRLADLPDDERTGALELVPGARSIIVLAKEIPVQVYSLPAKVRTGRMFEIAGNVDMVARRLTGCLNAEDIRSAPVPLILPIRIAGGRVQGLIRLKKIAAWGGLETIGDNSLLISPRFGTRLALGGVVTALDAGRTAAPLAKDLCGSCGRCTRACPGGAIAPDGVDAFRCRNITSYIPPSLGPVAKWLLNRQLLQTIAAPVAERIARHATMRCSLCVTVCPCFENGEKPQ